MGGMRGGVGWLCVTGAVGKAGTAGLGEGSELPQA